MNIKKVVLFCSVFFLSACVDQKSNLEKAYIQLGLAPTEGFTNLTYEQRLSFCKSKVIERSIDEVYDQYGVFMLYRNGNYEYYDMVKIEKSLAILNDKGELYTCMIIADYALHHTKESGPYYQDKFGNFIIQQKGFDAISKEDMDNRYKLVDLQVERLQEEIKELTAQKISK